MSNLVPRSILVATDLTDGCDQVLRSAGTLAQRAGADLHVLHSFDLESLPDAKGRTGPPKFQGRVAEAERALDDQIRRTVPGEVRVSSREVVIYLARKAIVERAAAASADLIVMGPHRTRPFADAFLGSTADWVIRTVGVPCLIIRGPLTLPLARVVVPIDVSGQASGALDVALAWAGNLGSDGSDEGSGSTQVSVVHVLPRAFRDENRAAFGSTVHPQLRQEVSDAPQRTRGPVPVNVQQELLWGDRPAEEIVRFAESEHTSLIVLATHGPGALERALIGSVASVVARRAPCPVLLVPPGFSSTTDS